MKKYISGHQRVFTGFKKLNEGHYRLDGIVHVYRGNVRFLNSDALDEEDNKGHVLVYNPKKYIIDESMKMSDFIQNLRAYTVTFNRNKFTGFVSEEILPNCLFKVNYISMDLLDEHAYITIEAEKLENGEFRLALNKFDWLKEGYMQSDTHFKEFFKRIRFSVKEEIFRLEALLNILIENGKALSEEEYYALLELEEFDSYEDKVDYEKLSEDTETEFIRDIPLEPINTPPKFGDMERQVNTDSFKPQRDGRVPNIQKSFNMADEDFEYED